MSFDDYSNTTGRFITVNCTLLQGADGCGVIINNVTANNIIDIIYSNGLSIATKTYRISQAGLYTVNVYQLNSSGIDVSVNIATYELVINSSNNGSSNINCKYHLINS